MEDLAPPLRFVINLRLSMENGNSVQVAIRQFIEEFPSNPFTLLLEEWLATIKKNHPSQLQRSSRWTPWRQNILDLLQLGLNGNPIIENLQQLENELIQACEEQIQQELQSMPLIVLIPVLIFQFPAYLILLLGPWLSDLLEQLR